MKTCELLAPAGGMEQLIAAVENGADAVYIGGRIFNARINAENFCDEALKEAIDYAHLRNVKVFITLNVLIKDEELNDSLHYASKLYQMGADALIIQDLGLAYLIKKYIPDFSLHFSTQGTVYNLSGVKTAKRLGFDRVVLARELSMKEIQEIAGAKACDIEVFVHGALCMCYSGQCQMSRMIGGRSGNRGVCAQPCRLPYRDETGKIGYYLSPKDICTIDALGDFAESGVKSLKIEGRMKSAEYVATVVSIYRKYLDLYYEQGEYTVSEEDHKALKQIFNRGGFTKGYLYGYPGSNLLSGTVPKHQGILIGKVASIPREKNLIDVSLSDTLHLGDGVELRNPDMGNKLHFEKDLFPGNIVTYIKPLKNNILRIGDFKGRIRKGDFLYRITSKEQLEKARQTYQGKKGRKIDIEMNFSAQLGQKPNLKIVESEDFTVEVTGDQIAQPAVNKALTEEAVKNQLRKTGQTPFFANKISVRIDEGISLPIAEINKVRRTALEMLANKKNSERTAINLPSLPKGKLCVEKKTITGPHFSNITKGNEDNYIKENFNTIVTEIKEREKELNPKAGVLLENLGWVDEFQRAGVKVYGGEGLNVCNWAAAEALQSIAVEPVDISPELKEEEVPLMTTEYLLPHKELTDRKGKKYEIRISRFGDKAKIYGK